ncbi:hypothetical protein [Reyranella sp.]|uniref:hypothetical protein n=1 Tax=Reyranella sp. TaxID=1929291 RepID=UPI003BAD60D1
MSVSEQRQKEIEDKALKVRNARKAAEAPGASERDKADLKIMEQELMAERQKALHQKEPDRPAGGKESMEKKLDSALKDSFPGSDPVSFIEAAPVKEGDKDLTTVKAKEGKTRD